ncbi:phosphoribosylformylglycinamidine synthase [Peptoniphilus asaccharolyticus DSM 20463]|uniref:Phosphoribosylformylglycinamidine synthase n=2 Tax=Peptoniphilus asaccharolyticus TaxID=1258 RepID=A0A1W1UYA0_PEPAS|nr:phosphoribosylformylglycinamidine synthase [Peptoniphilus asaccharolyticus]SMB86092.1 phosphoribosylformylglycinamidine synthase [Peptoniphilus asaccharolyticus DSM 20463]
MNEDIKIIYVRKKEEFDYESEDLKKEIKNSLNIDIGGLRTYRRYDLVIDNETLDSILYTILSEKPVDEIYFGEEVKKLEDGFENVIRVSYLPGQFDQREQGLLDTIALFTDKKIVAKVSKVYKFTGVEAEELKKIENLLVNPVDSESVELEDKSQLLGQTLDSNVENIVYDGFINYSETELDEFLKDKNLAMSLEDLKVLQDYFKSENRNPNETEVSIIDTYWSDHCRHTTFNTGLEIEFEEKTALDREIKNSFEYYLKLREELNITKPISLMSFGTILAKYLRKNGKLEDLEVSSEINACSVKIKVKVDVDGKEELRDYLLMFKNETHNHPTEIEPIGGASTCLGGAIRDPLSGRAFVYQAMRISGAADPFTSIKDTLEGKLPQKKITTEAAKGYSSYGNQIGLATGYVDEMYHPGYVAKRLEAGAVIAATPLENVKRIEPVDGDIVILLGGKTGRDGIGGATGSSKSHVVSSIKTESAQVQKGNAPEERKIQRLFRRREAAELIKKCNDFGAGGVSVAIGELADSIEIYLDRVPLKYDGLKPREIAISESQERMAVVVAPEDKEAFVKLAEEENLETTHVATVTDNGRMVMLYGEQTIADMSYEFINSTGADRSQKVVVESESIPLSLRVEDKDPKHLKEYLKDLNITSKKNLIELFDQSVGRATVLSPLGGVNQTVPIQAMTAKIPSFDGDVKTASLMSYGCNPKLLEESQYLGGYYAVIESIAKLIATGSSLENIRLSFQEFFERLGSEESWSKPLKALIGALESSAFFEAPPIGGKDSMSGTFENINVPPTLISFAVSTADVDDIVSPEFKKMGKLGLVEVEYDENGKLDLQKLKENFENIHRDILAKNIVAISAITAKGTLPQIYEQAIYKTGFNIELEDLYSPRYGSFIVEYKEDRDFIKNIGKFAEDIIVNGVKLEEAELEESYIHTLDKIFKGKDSISLDNKIENKKSEPRRLKSTKPVDTVRVVIPAFPGTNSEWDTKKAFEKEGAEVDILLFRNRTTEEITESIEEFAKLIINSQILAIPGGFSMGDEPDGSGKFIANVIRSPKVKEAIEYMLEENDGLILGICNGFQALIKTGLLPYGKIKELREDDPTLTFNTVGRHIASLVDTKLLTTNSPWLTYLDETKSYKVPISHGEGRFIGTEETIKSLFENEQVVAVYEDCPNGSVNNIEAVISKDGKILGKMGHSERVDNGLYKNIEGIEYQNIFKSGVEYFKER